MALGKLTLLQLRTRCRNRCDQASSQFVSDSELNDYINDSLYWLQDLLIEKYGSRFFVASPYTFTTDGTNNLFTLPTDFYKLIGADLYTGTNSNPYVSIRPFDFADRNLYRIPDAGKQLRLWYAPRLTELVSDSDTAEGIDGFLDFVVEDVVIKMAGKEESDTSLFERRLARVEQRIESAGEARDAANPPTMVDVYRQAVGTIYYPCLRYCLVGSQIMIGEYQTVYPFGGGYGY